MKKALKIIAGVALAGCMLLPVAACSNTDNSEDVKQLQQQVQDLQTEIDSLKNDNVALTGSPKFNYGINETIPYYVNGNKIFEYKVTDFHYSETTVILYTINYELGYSSKNVAISMTLCEKSTGSIAAFNKSDNNEGYFNMNTGTEKTINLFINSIPFARITATPTKK